MAALVGLLRSTQHSNDRKCLFSVSLWSGHDSLQALVEQKHNLSRSGCGEKKEECPWVFLFLRHRHGVRIASCSRRYTKHSVLFSQRICHSWTSMSLEVDRDPLNQTLCQSTSKAELFFLSKTVFFAIADKKDLMGPFQPNHSHPASLISFIFAEKVGN